MPHVQVAADVRLRIVSPDSPVVTGSVRADGQLVVVALSRTPFVSARGSRSAARSTASRLTEHGLTIEVSGPRGTLARIGHDAKASFWQAAITGSRHIELGSFAALADSLRGPRLFAVARPGGAVLRAHGRRRTGGGLVDGRRPQRET